MSFPAWLREAVAAAVPEQFVPGVPESQNVFREQFSAEKTLVNQLVKPSVPAVPAVPGEKHVCVRDGVSVTHTRHDAARLLRDDQRFIERRLHELQANRRQTESIMERYRAEWLAGVVGEASEIKQENCGRFRANQWLLRLACCID